VAADPAGDGADRPSLGDLWCLARRRCSRPRGRPSTGLVNRNQATKSPRSTAGRPPRKPCAALPHRAGPESGRASPRSAAVQSDYVFNSRDRWRRQAGGLAGKPGTLALGHDTSAFQSQGGLWDCKPGRGPTSERRDPLTRQNGPECLPQVLTFRSFRLGLASRCPACSGPAIVRSFWPGRALAQGAGFPRGADWLAG